MSAGNWKEMHLAAEKGDIELVSFHLKMSVDPNYQHPEFMTAPLLASIKNQHLDVARLLLENGAQPDIKEVWTGDRPMDIALRNKDQAAIDLLKEFMASA